MTPEPVEVIPVTVLVVRLSWENGVSVSRLGYSFQETEEVLDFQSSSSEREDDVSTVVCQVAKVWRVEKRLTKGGVDQEKRNFEIQVWQIVLVREDTTGLPFFLFNTNSSCEWRTTIYYNFVWSLKKSSLQRMKGRTKSSHSIRICGNFWRKKEG